MIQSVALFGAAVIVLPPAMGNHGLWLALMILNAARGLTMARRYHRAEAAAT
jgi:MATE family multidrug resistance protein